MDLAWLLGVCGLVAEAPPSDMVQRSSKPPEAAFAGVAAVGPREPRMKGRGAEGASPIAEGDNAGAANDGALDATPGCEV